MYISVSGPCPTDDIHGLYLKSFCRGLDRVLENYRIILRKLEMDVLSDEHLPVTHLVSFLQEVLTRILLANFRRKRICLIYCDRSNFLLFLQSLLHCKILDAQKVNIRCFFKKKNLNCKNDCCIYKSYTFAPFSQIL